MRTALLANQPSTRLSAVRAPEYLWHQHVSLIPPLATSSMPTCVTQLELSFVLTASVDGTLRCLARAVASADSPVLLQGPTR